ncbi:MAG TPA: class I SAM-dependent methyltransferase [Bacteroidales bacterium]|nr:class I SAM-dependent methyltransferase [Bacteroidales bacterium]
MIGKLTRMYSYVRYLLSARTKYGIHSPFVYSLVTEVFENHQANADTERIKALRNRLKRSKRVLEVTDFGSGRGNKPYALHFRTVGNLAAHSAVTPSRGELLYNLVNRFRPSTILELGTSLGISTLYLSTGNPYAKVITIEGCSTTSEVARENFAEFNLTNIKMLTGRFEDVLPAALDQLATVDFAFIDGHHEYEPTKNYARMIMQRVTENSVIVIDDIHWSAGMEKAWKEICSLPQVKVSIDVFRFGMLFFREGLSKQHFGIRYR